MTDVVEETNKLFLDLGIADAADEDLCAEHWLLKSAASLILSLQGEVERLRGALKVFARVADMEERAQDGDSAIIAVRHLRAARQALSPTGGG